MKSALPTSSVIALLRLPGSISGTGTFGKASAEVLIAFCTNTAPATVQAIRPTHEVIALNIAFPLSDKWPKL
jgi:hypothetical protein